MNTKTYLMQFYIEQNGKVILPELAQSIVEEFAITDSSKRMNGEKFTLKDSEKIGDKLGIDWNKINLCEWYLVLNNEYSDKYEIVKKYKLPEPQIYFDFALSWFSDVDASDDKTFKYFFE